MGLEINFLLIVTLGNFLGEKGSYFEGRQQLYRVALLLRGPEGHPVHLHMVEGQHLVAHALPGLLPLLSP